MRQAYGYVLYTQQGFAAFRTNITGFKADYRA